VLVIQNDAQARARESRSTDPDAAGGRRAAIPLPEKTVAWMNPRDSADPTRESSPVAPRVLLAEDGEEMRRLVAWTLRESGYEVEECADGWQLLQHLQFIGSEEPPRFSLIISDIRMPGPSGIEILESLHRSRRLPPMILITAFGDPETHREARRLGAAAMFDKPFDLHDLVAAVRRILPGGSLSR